ncbi:hypothetical protein [Virgibacillus profundi]|uniref:hypothetical protein n=1 Tax=Virgibacillus profundi TaxID=2024555 RepID=UPI0013FDC0A9|nr:hypothetical protein [Virgibacillus profundi]
MKLNMLIGTLLGFTTVFIIMGFVNNEFNWIWLIAMLTGGVIGHLGIAYLTRKRQ